MKRYSHYRPTRRPLAGLLGGLLLALLRPALAEAQTIVAENFNGAWTTPTTLTTVGTTGTWGDDGATGDQQWHRNDYPTGWTPNVFSYVQPTDADGVPGTYAAFHSTGAASGSTGSLVSPVLSFAAYPDHKVLSFYLSNETGADVVSVYLSTDGGLTYGSVLATYSAQVNAFGKAFRRVALDLGTTTSGSVRIKLTATADAGTSDIGVDNFQVVNQPLTPLSGVYTIDQTLPGGGTNFISFTEAFLRLNLAGVSGPTTFRVANGQTFNEQTPPLTVSGTAAAPILFQEATPSASLTDNPVIANAATQTGAVVLLSGADYVTFDGINVQYAGASLAQRFGYVVSNASATDGATYNTIRNAAITLSRDIDRSTGLVQATSTLYGGAAATSTAGTNQHNSYYNLKFSNMQVGVNLSGTSATYPDYDTQLYGCAVGDPGVTADIGGRLASSASGIGAFTQSKLSLHDNVVRNVVVTSANGGASGLSVGNSCGTGSDACNVYNNQVITVGTTNETMQRVTAMSVSTASSGVHTLNVYNNFVSEVLSRYSSRSATRTVYITGLTVGNGSGTPSQTINVSFNSVRIDTTPFPFLAASTCYTVESATGAVVNTRNNIFANVSQGKTTNNPIQPQHYAWVSPAAGAVGGPGSVSNYNDLYIAYPLNFAGGPAGFVGVTQGGTTYTTLADWQAATGQDANSVAVDPLFVSATNLHLQNASPLRGRGTPLAGISTDIDNLPRSSTAPDIGADEFESPSQDVGITALVQPGAGGGSGSTQPVEVTIRNFGTTATTLPVPVQVVVTAPGGATQTLSASYASPIAAGGSANLVVGNLLATSSGSYGFVATTTYASDPVASNNTFSTSVTLTTTNATAWTGAANTDWYDARNWSAGVPTATLDAQVPVVSSGRYPLLASGAAAAKNLTLSTGATLTQSGGTLSLTGDLTNNGTFAATGGTLATTGSARQALGGSNPLALYNLSIGAAGATLNTATSLRQVLTLVGDLATSGQPLTLRSSVSGGVATDALVVNSGGVVVGAATVQRAIDPSLNPGPGYRHFSTPVRPTIVNDFATITTGGSFTPLTNPVYNSGPAPALVQPFPTFFGYDDSRLNYVATPNFDAGFYSPNNLSEVLTVGRGYAVNIAADQLVALRGTLNNGDLPVPVGSTRSTYPDGGWQLLGNPYPAPLDYSRVDPADRLGLEAAIYVYSSTSQYAGCYRSYVNGIGNPVLPLGQGFFARVAAGQSSAILTFRNSQRLTAPTSTTFQRPAADPRPLVQLTLQNAGGTLADEAAVYFEAGATSGFEPAFDAEKLANPSGLNLATTQAGQQLSIDGQPELGSAQRVVPLAVGVPAPGVYTFTASQLLNLNAVPVYLRDAQTGALVDLAAQPSYQFTVANAAALNTTRFALVFSPRQVLATAPAALAEQVGLYPNPAKAQVTIELPAGLSRQPVAVALLDALGRVVRQQALPAGSAAHTLPLAGVAPGVYSLRLATGQGTVVKKLIVE